MLKISLTGKDKTEFGWKAFKIAFYRLIQRAGFDPVKPGKVGIKQHPLVRGLSKSEIAK